MSPTTANISIADIFTKAMRLVAMTLKLEHRLPYNTLVSFFNIYPNIMLKSASTVPTHSIPAAQLSQKDPKPTKWFK